MTNNEEVTVFRVEWKKPNDKRIGDVYVKMATEGCGCCSDPIFGLYNLKDILPELKRYIKMREEELERLKQFLDD